MEESEAVAAEIGEHRFEVVFADLAEQIDLAVVVAEIGLEADSEVGPAGRFVEDLRTSKALQKQAPRTLEQHALEAMEDF